ncbi:MAG: FHA domain-containing protein, partial [Chloroflexota bacterium]
MSNQDKNPSQPSEASGKSADPSESLQLPHSPAPASDKSVPESRQTLFVESVGKQTGITCPKCGQVNRPGILVCEKCGTLLVSDKQVDAEKPATKRFENEKTAVDDAEQTYRQASETSELLSAAMSSAGSTNFTENMVLRLEIDGAPTPILLHPKAETSIGRRDPATGTMPDVDLSAYAGYRLGVSRKHAFIRLKSHQLEIYDLGSSNGTSVNGVRLTAHQPHVLRDGDEILLGKMVV